MGGLRLAPHLQASALAAPRPTAHEDLHGTDLEAQQQLDAAFDVLTFGTRADEFGTRSLMSGDEIGLISLVRSSQSGTKHQCGTNDGRSGCTTENAQHCSTCVLSDGLFHSKPGTALVVRCNTPRESALPSLCRNVAQRVCAS